MTLIYEWSFLIVRLAQFPNLPLCVSHLLLFAPLDLRLFPDAAVHEAHVHHQRALHLELPGAQVAAERIGRALIGRSLQRLGGRRRRGRWRVRQVGVRHQHLKSGEADAAFAALVRNVSWCGRWNKEAYRLREYTLCKFYVIYSRYIGVYKFLPNIMRNALLLTKNCYSYINISGFKKRGEKI